MNSLTDSKGSSTNLWWVLVLVLALTAYTLPWLTTSSNGLSLSAYDLAEWISLHPAARYGQPPLLPTLLLRLPLVCTALTIAFWPVKHAQWLRIPALLMLTVALLPPVEFLTRYRDDPNYQQQFILAGITLIGGAIGISHYANQGRQIIILLLAGIAAITGILGFSQSYSLTQGLGIQPYVGMGTVVFIGGQMLTIGILAVRHLIKNG
ncbi:MAG: hypothetical protein K8I60_08955 [Anaerolineae bacterium]|nr:hypothetical protein [Anaerolineae bacterium]